MYPVRFKYQPALTAIIVFIILITGQGSYGQEDQGIPPAGRRYVRVDSIALSGNKITRDQIIYREITFRPGDYVISEKLDTLMERSGENLRNTSLFNFVDIDKTYQGADSSSVIVNVKVTERWYIWPTPILKISDRNFNVWWETKDLSRLSYGFYIDWKNFRGRKEHLILRLQWGYDRVVVLQYLKPYLNKKKTLGMGFGVGYARQQETAFQTIHNKQDFFKEQEGFVRQDIYAYGQMVYRKNIYSTHEFQLRYDQHLFSDSLIAANGNFTDDSSRHVRYLTFDYLYKRDHRDYKPYPLKGYYVDFEILKYGLWTFKKNTLNTFYVMSTFRKYWDLSHRFYFASGLNFKVSAGFQPYFILRGIGYDRDVVRSYEYYLVDAQHFCILKNNIKFALIPTQVRKIGFIKSEKFGKIFYALYMNIFLDAGYGYYNQDYGKETNDLQNSLLLGYGAGLDFVTYYDVVMRLEFAVNLKNETGFFLSFRAPI